MKKTLLSILAIAATTLSMSAQATGSAEKPLTVDEFLAEGTPSAAVPNTYVTGYIVGCVPQGGMNLSEAIFNLTDGEPSQTNVLIAASQVEDMVDYCVPVQLPSGAIRDALNLAANPGNLGREVTLCGSHEKYFGGNGLKSLTAYAFDGNKIEGGGTIVDNSPVKGLNESFAGGAIPANWGNVVLQGNKNFYGKEFQGVGYAAMTGYNGTGPFDSWLVSPCVDLDQAASKVLSFETQVNGYQSTTTEFKAYVLTDADPTKGTKTELTAAQFATAPDSGYSSWQKSGDLDLSSFSGKIYVAFNYTAPVSDNYATWCVTKVQLNAEAVGGDPVVSDEKGTQENPLTCADLTKNEAPAKDTGTTGWWVKGYVVGYVAGMNLDTAVFGAITDPETQRTNLLISDYPTTTSTVDCVPVQLPAGTIREKLNLFDNPDLLGKMVTVEGTYEKYFGVGGIKKVTSYKIDGGGSVLPSDHIFASLENDANGWEVEYALPLVEPLTYVWKWDGIYKNYKASAYVNGAYASDATAISPAIDMTGVVSATMTFQHAGNKFESLESAKEQVALMIREEGAQEWTNLEIPTWFENTSWSFFDCTVDLTAWVGKKVQLGLRYSSTDTKCGTWEVKNLIIDGETSGVAAFGEQTPVVRVENGCILAPAGAEAYTVSGRRSGMDNLEKGLYIVRVGKKAVKVVVR